MPGPQLIYYAAERAGATAIIETETGRIVAWIERLPDGMLRARHGAWTSEPVETVPQCIRAVSERYERATSRVAIASSVSASA